VDVVMLYMGDDFNRLIRPVLWRDLKAGARIVSHGFAMGGWLPDQTIQLPTNDGNCYDLYLWTITKEIKAGNVAFSPEEPPELAQCEDRPSESPSTGRMRWMVAGGAAIAGLAIGGWVVSRRRRYGRIWTL
jgi:LPXTG-motif cell wall-anchored protein